MAIDAEKVSKLAMENSNASLLRVALIMLNTLQTLPPAHIHRALTDNLSLGIIRAKVAQNAREMVS